MTDSRDRPKAMGNRISYDIPARAPDIDVLGHGSRKIRFFRTVPKVSQLVFRSGRFGERALLGANSIDQYKFQFICQLRFQLSSVANTVGHPVVLAKKVN